jgi:ABC-2 type transport system ATP-binding protein
VDGVSLRVERGEIFGLLGPNGAGKTTTISMIVGVEKADSGHITVGGFDTSTSSAEARRLLGFVPQDVSLYPRFSAWENLEYFGGLYGLSGADLRCRIGEVLEVVALTEYARRPSAGKFSGGMKRRLNLAAGLLHRPSMLLLDEPTVGVDAQSRNHIVENIRRLNREHGATILYTTHYMEEAEVLCDRVAIMDHGTIIANDSVPNLLRTIRGTVLDITLATPVPGFAAALRNYSGVLEVTERENRYQVTAATQKEGLASLQSSISADGAVLETLAVSAPNLEQVFLKLTGKELRDGAA